MRRKWNWKFLLVFSVILVTVIAFSGCTTIPGKYIAKGSGGSVASLTLYSDGTFYVQGDTGFGFMSLSGTWTQEGKDIILSYTGAMGQKFSVLLHIKEDGILLDRNGNEWIREDKLKNLAKTESATPKDVAREFVEAYSKGDKETLIRLSAGNLKKEILNIPSGTFEKIRQEAEQNLIRFEIVKEEVHNNKAKVSVKFFLRNTEPRIGLVELEKIGSEWKVIKVS